MSMPNVDREARYFGEIRNGHLYTPVPHGQREVPLTAQDILEFQSDPALFVARLFGATVEDYLAWREETNFEWVECSATLDDGRKCRGIIAGSGQPSFAGYLALRGSCCRTHGGSDADANRAVVEAASRQWQHHPN
jgi:hypothetical protein